MNDAEKKSTDAGDNDSDSSGDEFQSLLNRGRAGDDEAVGMLLSRYWNYLLLIANQDLDDAIRTKLGASDVAQQSMMLAQQNFKQFRGGSEHEFKAWIRTILQNDMLQARRHYGATKRRQVGREIRFQDSQNRSPDLIDPNLTPQSDALLKELAVEMERCLEQLSASHQQVVRLRNWQEKPFAEIGQIMGTSEDGARKLWFRAFTRLKEIVLKSRPEFASHLVQNVEPHPPTGEE